ncbi:MAG: hypothetical protein A2351_04070 [Omnitrophica bacterium RIFOXYB12_FULL_50_7]|nr:MAG: hypothetical protein A2351_04070 [Omnitrophica bacterium RIFOXYB12_FULL_50_7]
MELNLVLERLRQLKAADLNALAIYSDLQTQVEDKEILVLLSRLVKDEARHLAMEKEIFSLLRHGAKV